MRKKSSKSKEFKKIENENFPNTDFQNESSEFQSSMFVPVSPAFTDQLSLNQIEGGVISPMTEAEDSSSLPSKETLASFVDNITKNSEFKNSLFVNIKSANNKSFSYFTNENNSINNFLISKSNKKFDLFFADLSKVSSYDKINLVKNISDSLRPVALGYVFGYNKYLDDIVQSSGLEIIKFNNNVVGLKKNDLNKICSISFFKKNSNEEKCSFICDIADSIEKKIAGLQPYNDLKFGSGLLFPYEKTQDVIYHMGTVSFPIDIIFCDDKNNIKKIYKNIEPGSLATFGCSGVKNVVELPGGVCTSLSISPGDSISINESSPENVDEYIKYLESFSDKNNIFFKKSSLNKKFIFSNFEILASNSFNNSKIIKNASLLFDNKPTMKEYVIYNIDDILSDNECKIFLEKEAKSYSLSKFISDINLSKNSFIKTSKYNGFENFAATKGESSFEFLEFVTSLKHNLILNKEIILSSKFAFNKNILKDLIIKRASEDIIFSPKIHQIEVIGSSDLMSDDDLVSWVYQNKNANNVQLIKILKTSGVIIPNNIKSVAKEAEDLFSKAKDRLEEINNKMKHNVTEYEKFKDKQDVVSRSGPLFNQSIKKISKLIVNMLMNIKNAIKKMNKIKDVSEVEEKNDSLSISCKGYVETCEDTFALLEKIEEPNFIDLLKEETSKSEKSFEDINNNLDNYIQYISKNILNKKVLTK